jgi:hypothetical protein
MKRKGRILKGDPSPIHLFRLPISSDVSLKWMDVHDEPALRIWGEHCVACHLASDIYIILLTSLERGI